jgi:hypothetical protein
MAVAETIKFERLKAFTLLKYRNLVAPATPVVLIITGMKIGLAKV